MVRARLHIICGNCGSNEYLSYQVDLEGQDFGEYKKPSVQIHCGNCSTIHVLDEMKEYRLTHAERDDG